jgi:hypothetical protein
MITGNMYFFHNIVEVIYCHSGNTGEMPFHPLVTEGTDDEIHHKSTYSNILHESFV